LLVCCSYALVIIIADVDAIESVDISGDPVEGQMLRALVTGFFDDVSFQWYGISISISAVVCFSSVRFVQRAQESSFVAIDDATDVTYTIQPSDIGGQIRVEVTPIFQHVTGRTMHADSEVIHSGICNHAMLRLLMQTGPPCVTSLEIKGSMFHTGTYMVVAKSIGASDETSNIEWRRSHSKHGPFVTIAGVTKNAYVV